MDDHIALIITIYEGTALTGGISFVALVRPSVNPLYPSNSTDTRVKIFACCRETDRATFQTHHHVQDAWAAPCCRFIEVNLRARGP